MSNDCPYIIDLKCVKFPSSINDHTEFKLLIVLLNMVEQDSHNILVLNMDLHTSDSWKSSIRCPKKILNRDSVIGKHTIPYKTFRNSISNFLRLGVKRRIGDI